jgi:protein involved in polysaccharide export with SLBB domain
LESINTIQVYALGLVNNPGSFRLSSTSKAINGIIASGGFTKKSSLRTIKITRGDDNEERIIDLYDFLIGGKINSDFYLRNGDSILVQARKNSVSISGSVNRPAIYEVVDGERFSDLLSFALGFSENADKKNISLRRKNEYGQYTTSQVNLTSDFQLQNGDIISVGSAEGEWVEGIQLVGAIRNIGEYAYSSELTLGELIKLDRDLLNNTYPSIITIKRFSSITRSYSYLVLDLLSQDRLDKFLLSQGDKVYIYSHEDISFLNSSYVQQALMPDQTSLPPVEKVLLSGEVVNPNACLGSLRGFSSGDFISTTLLKFKVVKPSNNAMCTSMLSEQPTLLPILLNRSIPVFGEITNPGLYPVSPFVTGKEALQIAGGEVFSINSSYNYEVGYFANAKIQIDNNLENINLKFLSSSSLSGIPDEAFVELLGEFKFPGVYKINSTTTLSEIIARAGGLKDTAFPAGGILTREIIKSKEADLLKRAESELVTIITQGITTGVIEQSSEDVLGLIGLVRQLGSVEPTGRLVTELDPIILARDKGKDILLTSADKIYMPTVSNTITISGSVLSPITVAYDPSKNLKDYIALAGGYAEGAETGDTYIVMPNGLSVKGNSIGRFFSDQYIRPGATIIVPRKARPLGGLSLVEAITPILANLSITMASIVSITDR